MSVKMKRGLGNVLWGRTGAARLHLSVDRCCLKYEGKRGRDVRGK